MNILIIGLGSIANKHIHALHALLEDVNIYALRSNANAEPVEKVTSIFDLEEVSAITFDFAIISNPTSAHYNTITSLLKFGIPLFIEKPLFHAIENGQELVNQCKANSIKTYVACNLRFHPCIRFLKQYLENNSSRINEVNIYAGSYLPNWRPNRDFRTIYSAIPELGGGVHLDLIHELDYTWWLLGAPLSHQKILTNKSSLDIAAIDFAHYNLMYSTFTANITLNYYRRDSKREIEILLDDGTLTADIIAGKVTLNGELLYEEKIDVYYTYIEQMKYFLKNINNSHSMNNIEEAFQILKICLQ